MPYTALYICNKLYISTKQHCIFAKRALYIRKRALYISKEPNLFAKEPYMLHEDMILHDMPCPTSP